MDKLVIIVDGPGGIGKDSFIEAAAEKFFVKNVSSIDPIKDIATYAGWKGEKTPQSRKMLADLKTVFTEYNDLPNTHVHDEIVKFVASDSDQILFVHIREPENIDIARWYCQDLNTPCTTLLVTGPHEKIGNRADDDFSYDYDFTFNNEHSENGIDKARVMAITLAMLRDWRLEPELR